jgi:hypothetical protein
MRTALAFLAAAAVAAGCAARRGRSACCEEEGASPAAPPVAAAPLAPAPAPYAAPAPAPAFAAGPMDAASLARAAGLRLEDQGTSVLLSNAGTRARFFPNNDHASIDGRMVPMGDAARREGPVLWVPEGGVKLVRRAAQAALEKDRVAREAPRPVIVPAYVPKPTPASVALPARRPAPAFAAPRGWEPAAREQAWTWIVIHHSDDREGSCRKYDDVHRRQGWDGCGYHWVVGNGTQTGDGEVETSDRWREQKIGAHTRVSPTDNRYNERGIGIVLVGDFEKGGRPTPAQYDSTVRLTRWLMARYGITADRVLRHQDCKATACPGKNFPWARFQADLQAGPASPP